MSAHSSPIPVRALGIDIDDTITANPLFFSRLTAICRKQGIPVHIVSSRSREGLRETADELRTLAIHYDFLHLTASISEAQKLCPHRELVWFARHQWLKVAYAQQENLSHFVDDDSKVIALFKRYAPQVEAIPIAEATTKFITTPIVATRPSLGINAHAPSLRSGD